MKLFQQGGDRRVFIELSDNAEKELERLFWDQGEWSNTPCALAIVNGVLHIHWLEPSHTYHVMPDRLPPLAPTVDDPVPVSPSVNTPTRGGDK